LGDEIATILIRKRLRENVRTGLLKSDELLVYTSGTENPKRNGFRA
jgi:hypothetical protein